MIAEVTRHSDGRVCALYLCEQIGLDQFLEIATEYAEAKGLKLQSRYSPYWDNWRLVGKRSSIKSVEEGIPVTAIDLLKWKR